MSITYGKAFVWGIPKEFRPIVGIPEGAQSVVVTLHADNLGRCVITTKDGAVHHYGLWYPEHVPFAGRQPNGQFDGPWGLMRVEHQRKPLEARFGERTWRTLRKMCGIADSLKGDADA